MYTCISNVGSGFLLGEGDIKINNIQKYSLLELKKFIGTRTKNIETITFISTKLIQIDC